MPASNATETGAGMTVHAERLPALWRDAGTFGSDTDLYGGMNDDVHKR